jgi:hypothetical protein
VVPLRPHIGVIQEVERFSSVKVGMRQFVRGAQISLRSSHLHRRRIERFFDQFLGHDDRRGWRSTPILIFCRRRGNNGCTQDTGQHDNGQKLMAALSRQSSHCCRSTSHSGPRLFQICLRISSSALLGTPTAVRIRGCSRFYLGLLVSRRGL